MESKSGLMLVPSIALIWNTSFQSPSPETASTMGKALSRVRRRSVLLMETIAGVPEPATRRARYLSPFPSPSEACVASKSKRMTSDSERLSTTCSCILARRVSRGFWEPGVSTKIAWYPGPLRTPRIGLRVVWGRDEVMETFWPTSLLTRVLLPTFGLPTTVIKPLRSPLHWNLELSITWPFLNSPFQLHNSSQVLRSERVGEHLVERVASQPLVIFHDNLFATELPQDLAAGSAGKAWGGVRAEDGDQFDLPVFGVSGGHGRGRVALRADGEPVGGVLDVGARVYGAASCQDGRAHVEVAVWRVSPACGRAGGLHHGLEV